MKKRIEELIEETLRTEPEFKLRNDFSDRMIRLIKKKEKTHQRKIYFWMLLGILMIIGFGYGTFSYFMPTALESLQALKANGKEQIVMLAVIAGFLVIIVQYLDQKLVKERMIHTFK